MYQIVVTKFHQHHTSPHYRDMDITDLWCGTDHWCPVILIHNDILDTDQASMSRPSSWLSRLLYATCQFCGDSPWNHILIRAFPRICLICIRKRAGWVHGLLLKGTYFSYWLLYWWSNVSLYRAGIYFCTAFWCPLRPQSFITWSV